MQPYATRLAHFLKRALDLLLQLLAFLFHRLPLLLTLFLSVCPSVHLCFNMPIIHHRRPARQLGPIQHITPKTTQMDSAPLSVPSRFHLSLVWS